MAVLPQTDRAALELLHELLRRSHLSTPSDLAQAVAEVAASIGASEVTVYLVDYEQAVLVPVSARDGSEDAPVPVTGTIAGRAFSSTTILKADGSHPGARRVWLPLLDGTERVGVMSMSFEEPDISDALLTGLERYAHLVAMLIVTKSAYGDAFESVRRRKPMTLASELAWALAPPLVFATDDVVVAGMLEPAYDNGGDAFDYAVNGRVLHLGIFDAMGHGLPAAGVAAFAVSAYRHSRRAGLDLLETHAAMDHAVGEQFPDRRFVTALIAQLDLDRGRLTWVSAGHPPPLLLREGRRTQTLPTKPVPPLGVKLDAGAPTMATEFLEPGDHLLFYSDGLIEARGPDGTMFTLEDMSQFIEREAAAGQIAPETMRRIRHAIIGRERAELRDDATALLIEWRSGSERRLLPQTILPAQAETD